MNAGTAIAIGIGLLALSGRSKSPAPSGARPGSTAGNARNSSKSGSGGFPSPFGAGAGRGGFNLGGDIIDTTDLFNSNSVIDFPQSDVSVPLDFGSVGTGTDSSQLNDIATLGVDNSLPQFDPGASDPSSSSSDFGVAGDPGIVDSGSSDGSSSSDGTDFGGF